MANIRMNEFSQKASPIVLAYVNRVIREAQLRGVSPIIKVDKMFPAIKAEMKRRGIKPVLEINSLDKWIASAIGRLSRQHGWSKKVRFEGLSKIKRPKTVPKSQIKREGPMGPKLGLRRRMF